VERLAIETNYHEVATGEWLKGHAVLLNVAAELSEGRSAYQGSLFFGFMWQA